MQVPGGQYVRKIDMSITPYVTCKMAPQLPASTHQPSYQARRFASIIAVLLFGAVLVCSTASAANKGILPPPAGGELVFEDQNKPITILGFSYSIEAESMWSGSGGGSSIGKAYAGPVRFTKAVDSVSITLLKAIASGKLIPRATYTVTADAGGKSPTKLVYQFEELLLVNVTQVGSSAAPLEEVSFTYKTVKWSFTDADGKTVNGGWDTSMGKVN